MQTVESYNSMRQQVDDVIQHVANLLLELVEGPTDGSATNRQLLIDENLHNFWHAYYSIKKSHAEQNFTVAVLALTKSGKSTLLNAFVGMNLLPANNVPETARICRLTHMPELCAGHAILTETPLPSASCDQQTPAVHVEGVNEINAFLRELNQVVRRREFSKRDEALLEVQLSMAALSNVDASSAVRLQLLDTPGPNEAGEEGLRFQVERLLEGVDAVVYLLDYTKLKTAEEALLLQRLKQLNPGLVERLAQRLFFVVNKVDLMGYTEGLDQQQTQEYVSQLITAQMGMESFQLKPEQVLLVSAREALLSRLVLSGDASRDSLFQFCRMAFGVRRNPETIPPKELRDVAAEVLASSGLCDLESRMLSFLYSQAGELKMQATVDNLMRLMQQVGNVCTASVGALESDVNDLELRNAALHQQLEEVLGQFDLVQQETEIVEGLVTDTIRNRMECLKCHLFERVNAALYCQENYGRPMGRWSRVWSAAQSLFSSDARSRSSRQEMEQRLQSLHNEVMQEINTEVSEFWHSLEIATNQQQSILFAQLNSLIEQLSRSIEDAVSESLNVRLEPVDLKLVPPTSEQFHSDLEQLFARGIHSHHQQRRAGSGPCNSPWRELQDSLCRFGNFYVHQRSTTRERKWVEVCSLEQDEVVQYFVETIDGAIDNSLRNIRSFVRSYVGSQIQQARAVIKQYGERYTTSMIATLETCKKGEAHRVAALQRAQQQAQRIASLMAVIAKMQANSCALSPIDVAEELHGEEDDVHLVQHDDDMQYVPPGQSSGVHSASDDSYPHVLQGEVPTTGQTFHWGFDSTAPLAPPTMLQNGQGQFGALGDVFYPPLTPMPQDATMNWFVPSSEDGTTGAECGVGVSQHAINTPDRDLVSTESGSLAEAVAPAVPELALFVGCTVDGAQAGSDVAYPSGDGFDAGTAVAPVGLQEALEMVDGRDDGLSVQSESAPQLPVAAQQLCGAPGWQPSAPVLQELLDYAAAASMPVPLLTESYLLDRESAAAAGLVAQAVAAEVVDSQRQEGEVVAEESRSGVGARGSAADDGAGSGVLCETSPCGVGLAASDVLVVDPADEVLQPLEGGEATGVASVSRTTEVHFPGRSSESSTNWEDVKVELDNEAALGLIDGGAMVDLPMQDDVVLSHQEVLERELQSQLVSDVHGQQGNGVWLLEGAMQEVLLSGGAGEAAIVDVADEGDTPVRSPSAGQYGPSASDSDDWTVVDEDDEEAAGSDSFGDTESHR